MYKRTIQVAVLALLLIGVVGCPGAPKEEMGNPPGMTTDGGPDGGTPGGDGGERPDRGGVTSEDEAINRLQTIYFDFDKYDLRDDAKRGLEQNAEILKENPGIEIVIEGNCDERGTNEYNLALGERRAKAARDYLVRLGIDESRLGIRSYGEERPVAMGHDESAWAQNRRDEFSRR